jgi:hypothetical protein
MMRTVAVILVVLLALIVVGWIISDGVSSGAMRKAGEESWPLGLGTLASVEARVQPRQTNDAARQLIVLVKPLDLSFAPSEMTLPPSTPRTAIGEYVRREHARAEAAIGEPPAEVVTYLDSHASEIDALRDHLLRSESIQWDLEPSKGYDGSIPSLRDHMQVARLLAARALVRGRAQDVQSWDDLHAVWRLTQSLEARPELISQLIVLAMARMVNAEAWKLPAPAPAWVEELRKVDHRRLLTAAHQYEMWGMWRLGDRSLHGVAAVFARPVFRWQVADTVRFQRKNTEELAAITACGFDGAAFARRRVKEIPRWNTVGQMATPNLDAIWQRAFRFVPEREATMNAMRIAEGQPIVATSACSDGAWRFENDRLSFSRDLPKANESESVMPLSLAIPARATRRST